MKPEFWKLSQGIDFFSFQEIIQSIEQRLVYIHKKTLPRAKAPESQASNFINCRDGAYFYLTHGNTGIYLLGQFSGPANIFSLKGEGWLDRPFRFIRGSILRDPYPGEPHKQWTPNDHSTFTPVPEKEHKLFEKHILVPYFAIKLKDFGI